MNKIPKDAKMTRVKKDEFYCEHSKCGDSGNLNATREFDTGPDLTWRCEKHTPAGFKRKTKAPSAKNVSTLKDIAVSSLSISFQDGLSRKLLKHLELDPAKHEIKGGVVSIDLLGTEGGEELVNGIGLQFDIKLKGFV
jgi:hypothetical protein